MEIVRLPVGEPASIDTDCLRIEERADATFRLTASALCIDVEDGESASIIGGPTYPSAEQAETAGIAWATKIGVERLFISTGTLDHRLELLEIDKPL